MNSNHTEQKPINLEENTEPIFIGNPPQELSHSGTPKEVANGDVVDELKIKKTIDSWGRGLIILGIIQIIAAGRLSSTWGLMLIAVGIASFFFHSSVMMVIYAFTIAWASVSNILSGNIMWIGFAVVQWVLVFQVSKSYVKFKKLEAEVTMVSPEVRILEPDRPAAYFPLASFALGIFSFAGFLGTLSIVFILGIINSTGLPDEIIGIILELFTNIGVLAVALGLGSLLSRYPKGWAAICGLTFGSFILLFTIILSILSM